MELEACCAERSLEWRQSRVRERRSDVQVCTGCGRIHAMESWLVPLKLPETNGCVNCGGTRVEVLGDQEAGDGLRCDRCGLSEQEDRDLHGRLAASKSGSTLLRAATEAAEVNRYVLSLKLSTAAMHWGCPDPSMARTLRLQALMGMGFAERGLEEAYAWMRAGAPSYIWVIIADLEAAVGNLRGSAGALQHALSQDPDQIPLWVDLAELLARLDQRSVAIRAARHGLDDPQLRPRALQVITDIAERHLADEDDQAAMEAARVAGPLQERNGGLAWLQAQLAARAGQADEAVRWLEVVLQIDPAHEEAQAALKKLRPPKRGWRFWR